MITSGACQLAKRVTTHAVASGLMIEPTCPVVFMLALSTAVCGPPISMQAAHVALKVNIEAATAAAIRQAASTGDVVKTEANIAAPASE